MKIKYSMQKYISIFLITILVFSSFPNVNYAEGLTVSDDNVNEETINIQDNENGKDDQGEITEDENADSDEKNEQLKLDEHGKQANEVKNQHSETKTNEDSKPAKREVRTAPKGITAQSSDGDDDEEDPGDEESGLSSDELKALVDASVNKTVNYYKENLPTYSENNKGSHSDYWVYSALWSAGVKDLRNELPWSEESNPWLESTYWSEGINEKNATSNEDAGAIIGSSLLGLNPYEFGDQNVVEDLVERQMENGSFFTAWGDPWAMIALDLVGATYNRDALITHMLSTHHESGLFGGSFGDSDATGWALLALAPYRNDNEEVGNAIEHTINKTREHYIEENKILGQMFGANSNSTAALLMGLAANGVDLTTADWTNDQGNIVEQFIHDFQQEDGSFWWQTGNAGAVGMATEQSLLALATIKAGQSTFQLMKEEISVPGEEPSDHAGLSKLVIDNGIGEVPIHNEQDEYEYTIDGTVESIEITPTVDDVNATVTIAGEVVETNQPYTIELNEGRNIVEVKVTAENTETIKEYKLILIRNRVLSASQVKEFLPAPGQFVNKAPWGLNPERTLYSSGVGQGVSLGSFGGYIIFEFDEPIKNNPNNPYGVDFIVHGNAFSGNEEPGGIQVKSEKDGTWYDIAGSEHYEDETITNYKVTYTNPHDDFSESAQDVPWKDSEGKTGFVNANNFHKQPYYPNPEKYNTKSLHVSTDQLSYAGVKLNNRKVKFGYVDAFPEGSRNGEGTNPYTSEQKGAPIDLSWAVDSAGQPVHLEEVKYVKVYTSMLENLGSLGEISTEVTGITRVKQGERVGDTEDLNKILVNDIEVDLTNDNYVYDITVDAAEITVTAKGSAENIYINNEKTDSGNKSKLMTINEDEARTVRVIAQDGKDSPKIYYVNITKGEEEKTPSVDKTQLETLVNEAKEIDLSNMTDDSKEKLAAILNDATTILNNDEATQQEVDDAKLAIEKAIENLKERAPPITVNVRIETHEQTLVPTTELEVEPFNLMEYINGNNSGKSVIHDEARAIHAIIQALETIDGFDAKDDSQFGLSSGGNYIQKVGKDAEFTGGPLSGWMYFVDNEFAPVGVGDFKIKDGQSIVLYYLENYIDSTFSWFEEEYFEVEANDTLQLTLHGNNSTAGAHLLINEKPYEVDGELALVDEDGNISVTFDEVGTYHLSANRVNSDGERNIVRPYAIVEVVEGEEETPIEPPVEIDEEPPVITISGIEDGQTITEDSITFTVVAEDDVDGKVLPTVTANGKGLTRKKDNEYTAKLVEGSNDFVITAVDEAGNKTETKLTITYEPIVVNKDVEQAIDDVVSYLLKGNIASEWEAVGLAKAGVEVPEQYETVFTDKIENEIIDGLKSGRFQITDAERLTLAALALGEDPRNIDGINLIELIYNSPDRKLWDGSIEDTMTYQGNNGLAFALIALDAAGFEVPEDARWTRETLVAKLVKTQREDGAWNLNDLYPAPSVDITAMVMTALAPYKDDKKVQTAIDKAVDFLVKEQTNEGGFDGGSFVGGITSEATSQVIIGLTANGIDPTGEKFTKSQNLIDHLLSFQHKDGGFTHTLGDSNSNNMATEQALQALVAYDLFVRGEGALYKFDFEHDDEGETGDNEGETGDDDNDNDENDKGDTPETIVIEKNKLGEEIGVKENQTIVIQDSASKVELPGNLPEGTTVKINIPDKKQVPKQKDKLELAGDWYDFTFDYGHVGEPSEKLNFILTLAVDENTSLEDAEIYHYNVKNDKWEYIKAKSKNKEDHTITVEVSHFSIYAVLAKTSDDTSDTPGESNTGNNGANNNQGGNKGNDNSNNQDYTGNDNDDVTGEQNGNEEESGTKGTVIVDGSSAENDKQDSKNQLPSTATNYYNTLLIGLLFFMIGSGYVMYRRRKVNH